MSDQPAIAGADRASAAPTPLAPLGRRLFAVLWLATLASNIGTWMNDVGAGWLMTTLSPSPTAVALVQAATTLPVFLFAVPAGALADVVDRRRLLLTVNLLMAVVAGVTTILVATEAMTVDRLLVLTFLLGAGTAFMAPAWQAIVPGLVPRQELTAAIALDGVGINLSRAIGPALAGALIVSVGQYAPFLVNALSFVGIIAALWLWRGERRPAGALPPEHLLPAMVGGLRYARHSRPLQRTILRAVGFFVFASAYWAMLPLIARDVLGGGAGLYGLLLTCVGAGAVGGALLLPKLRAWLDIDHLVLGGALGTAAAMSGMALLQQEFVAGVAALLAGACWMAVLSSFQVSAQTALPDWVRARGLSLFLMAFFGAMSGGAVLWGLIATELGVPGALSIAAAGMALAAVLTRSIGLTRGDTRAFAPSLHWPAPPVVVTEDADAGPVMVTVDYRVAPGQADAFHRLVGQLRASRLRDGAFAWHLYRLLEEDGVLRETFMLHSWLDHLRQHERVTGIERKLQAEIHALLLSGEAPRVRHHVPATSPI